MSDNQDLLRRAEVIAMLHRLAGNHADLAIYGEDANARQREAMEAAFTHARCAVALMPAEPAGEEFLEFKEALSDIRALRHEHDCLNGGGPGWQVRNHAAWAKVDELFANEDEAAHDRQQESLYG